MDTLKLLLIPVVYILVWYTLNKWILPWFGVKT